MLRARSQPAAYILVPGTGHTWRGARRELPYALAFATHHLRGQQPRSLPLAATPHPTGRP